MSTWMEKVRMETRIYGREGGARTMNQELIEKVAAELHAGTQFKILEIGDK